MLTDGANTYYTPGWQRLRRQQVDLCGLWLCRPLDPAGYTTSRIFQGTTVSKTDYSNANYTKAMDAQFDTLCDNAKAADMMVMTVSLDLRTSEHRREKAIRR